MASRRQRRQLGFAGSVDLFVDGLAASPHRGQGAVLLFEASLGELILMTKVSSVNIHDGADRPDDAFPLGELLNELGN